jgi:D-threonate/D-erythronate kinase
MVNVLNVLSAKGIELLDYVIPQADLGRIIGGTYDGLVVVGKGGLTGADDTAISIVKRICREAAKSVQPEVLNV